MRTALTIAGSDSSGGAGIQADLKTFAAHGVYGMSVLTAITAQNTLGVQAVENVSPELIGEQVDAIFTDLPVHSVKIGMVSTGEAIDKIAEKLAHYNPEFIILDPVMISKSGHSLLDPLAKQSLKEKLLPLATLLTPNIDEAMALTGFTIESVHDMERAARAVKEMGVQAVLIKGGHLKGDPIDVFFDGIMIQHLKGNRIVTPHTHGTGCTLSSAIAAQLAKGKALFSAVEKAKQYVEKAIELAPELGHGAGPLQHFYWMKADGDNGDA